jgi:hypothetical protein
MLFEKLIESTPKAAEGATAAGAEAVGAIAVGALVVGSLYRATTTTLCNPSWSQDAVSVACVHGDIPRTMRTTRGELSAGRAGP